MEANNIAILDIFQNGSKFTTHSNIEDAIEQAHLDIVSLNETIASVDNLKPNCDKLDYTLSACSGALCGLIDIFLIGKPRESPLGNITDKWFEDRTCDFAKRCGWKGAKDGSNPLKSAIGFLERHYHIPYDQRGMGDAGSEIFGLNAKNHHFKSLGHNPSLLGLFFSILNQFTNTSHFISNGEQLELLEADGSFELKGNSVIAKLWCGFTNWFCHLMSDISGSSGSKGRGMGIPSPLWTWTNDIISIKSQLNIPVFQFDKDVNELALNIYEQGFDLRFQTVQTIPVIINELVVRLFYSIRRLIKYFKETNKVDYSFKSLWTVCEPFSNPNVKRMLTIAHATFCLVDITDATIHGFVSGGGNFNGIEFFLRLNVAGVGRFSICLFGETKRAINIHQTNKKADLAERQKAIVENYIEGLNILKAKYDDEYYLSFVDDLRANDYKSAFAKSISLPKLRDVPSDKIVNNKKDIDNYFNPKRL